MTRALGIDVYHGDGAVDFNKAAANGVSFAFIKASQFIPDHLFAENWKNAKSAGLLRGAYHYLNVNNSEINQAELFVKTMGNDFGELPPVLDLEENYTQYGMTSALVLSKAWNFLSVVERLTGRKPMLYCGYYYADFTKPIRDWTRFPLWLAWYASEWWIKICSAANTGTGVPKPWKNWTFWQNSSRADGLKYGTQSKMVDTNYFNGTVEELRLFANVPVVPVTGFYKVASSTLKVFAGPGDMYKQVSLPLAFGTQVKVSQAILSNGELWAQIETGWVRATYLVKI